MITDEKQKKVFSKNLLQLLSKYNLTQKEVADKIGVSPQTFNTWCQGIAIPRMGKIQKLSDYFGIKKSELIDGVKKDTTDHNMEIIPKMDEPQFIVSESKIKKFFSKGNSDEQATGQAFDILENFTHLNEEGQEKLADYADDLVSSGKYKKHNQTQVGKEA